MLNDFREQKEDAGRGWHPPGVFVAEI